MRSYRLYAFSLISAGFLAVASASPALAEDKPVDVSATARGISMPSPTHASPSPDNAYGGLAMTIVAIGEETSGVPCGQCVPTAGGNNIGLPWPVFTLEQGETMSVSTWFASSTYTGPCTVGLLLKNSGTIVASGSYPWPGGCEAGYLYGVIFTVPVPTKTGFTQVIGQIAGGGTNKSGTVSFIDVQ
ncbi:MAG: hypothetical protein ABSH50_04155 [Bryobacteraceae bacterium]|jgi:hypothetical protein